jgi:uncharacterized damage-inducible protein DinB
MPELTANDIIVHSLTGSQMLLMRYTEDLKPEEYLHRTAPGANCAAWLLGHLALSDRSVLSKRLNVGDLPTLPEGFEKAFSRDEGCPQANSFGDVSMLRGIFNQHRERLIAEVKRLSPAKLSEPLEKPHPMFSSVGQVINFMALHSMMHAGQITMIRRSLGRPPIA